MGNGSLISIVVGWPSLPSSAVHPSLPNCNKVIMVDILETVRLIPPVSPFSDIFALFPVALRNSQGATFDHSAVADTTSPRTVSST